MLPSQPSMSRVAAVQDARLDAIVVEAHALQFTNTRAHVRAASGLAPAGELLLVVQDDAPEIAVLDTRSFEVTAIPLLSPSGEPLSHASDKSSKLDLEACFVNDGLFVALGSGATPNRERLVVMAAPDRSHARNPVRVRDGHRLYEMLRANEAFAAGGLNIEGATVVADRLRLFQRGLCEDGVRCRTLDLAWPEFRAWLEGPLRRLPPSPLSLVEYDLGRIDGVPLAFTDAASAFDGVYFTAAAEASCNAVDDGPVAGVCIGMLGDAGHTRWTILRLPDGSPFLKKAEGLAITHGGQQAWIVTDEDDPNVPAELCRVALSGFSG
jgi:hypothetical protein